MCSALCSEKWSLPDPWRMQDGYDTDTVTRLETNLDDLSPEITGAVMEKLFAAGALDVWFTPVQMKKNRPGVLLALLCEEAAAEDLAEIIFRETTAFGLRMERIVRLKLGRRMESITTPVGTIRVKLGLKGSQIIQVSPEFESCRQVSEASGLPLRQVYTEALRCWHEQHP